MATSANIGLDLPARGSNVGVWDTPVNGDFSILDQAFGSVTTIALTSAPVTLATSQAQNAVLRFTGTLNSNVAVTCASIYKFWTVDNQITNSPSSYCVTLVSTSGASIIGLPQGTQDVFYDGTTCRYKNLGKLGEYWDYAGDTVPSWVTASTVPPYLNCNGTTFSSATYPQLANLLGTTTLPDSRGRNRYALNQTSSRLTSTGAGIDGNTAYAAGGSNGVTIGTSHIPTLTSSGTNSITVQSTYSRVNFPLTNSDISTANNGSAGNFVPYSVGGDTFIAGNKLTGSNNISVTYTNSSQQAIPATTPGYVGGITMIRAGIN